MDEFLSFVADLFGITSSELSLATEYQGVPPWDSLMHLRLVMEMEAQYGVEIPLELITELTTLGMFYDLISRDMREAKS